MSTQKPTRREPSQDAAAANDEAGTNAAFVPLKPRTGLFIALCVAFGIWIGLLTTLYFTSVHGRVDPHDHHRDADAGRPPASAAAR